MSAGIKAIEFYLKGLAREYERIGKSETHFSAESNSALEKIKKEMLECEEDLEILRILKTNNYE